MAATTACVLVFAVLVVTLVVAPKWTTSVCLVVLTYLALRYNRIIYVILVTAPRDVTGVMRYVRFLKKSRRLKDSNATVVSLFCERATLLPDRTCFMFEDRVWTNRDVNEYSNRVANVFNTTGLKHGDTVALCMDNRPEYVCIWLGLAKLGVVTALINTNLRKQQLLHCLEVASAKALIYSEQTAPAIYDILGSLDTSIKLYHLEPLSGAVGHRVTSLTPLLEDAATTPPKIDKEPCFSDNLLYIYTSGTTGLPKAAILRHSRYQFMALGVATLFDVRPDDVIYNPLPLYHGAGGVLGVGPALIAGNPVAIVKKFSASAYWKDCIKYNCTVGQYIGEVCRYLLACPPKPEDRQHKVRMIMGNGLRPALWQQFLDRFNVSRVAELYGSTEGNATLANMDGKIGAVGYIPRWAPWSSLGIGLIRINEAKEPMRGDNGLCIRCVIGEVGMFVGIVSTANVSREFHGYVDKKATEKKIIYNVLKMGDKAYVSGDILVMDEYGYMYFKDRTGDTFRWKGENVSTAEVEAAIVDIIGLRECSVYGVEVPGNEGRVGMAAVVDADASLDMDALASGLDRMLASYARPLFLRVVAHMDMTGTYKMKKVEFQNQGFNPATVKDKLYVRSGVGYAPLTEELYQKIVTGGMRL